MSNVKVMSDKLNERIEQLESAFDEITRQSDYEACYDIAVKQLDIADEIKSKKQLDHVTHLVGSMSHLPAIETGQAIIDYLKG